MCMIRTASIIVTIEKIPVLLHLDFVACTGKTHLNCERVSQHIFFHMTISIDNVIDITVAQWWYVVSQEEKMDVFVIVCQVIFITKIDAYYF